MKDKNQTSKEANTLENELKAFINAQPYWAKYLCSEILAGKEITDTIIDSAYSDLLEKLGLKKETKKCNRCRISK